MADSIYRDSNSRVWCARGYLEIGGSPHLVRERVQVLDYGGGVGRLTCHAANVALRDVGFLGHFPQDLRHGVALVFGDGKRDEVRGHLDQGADPSQLWPAFGFVPGYGQAQSCHQQDRRSEGGGCFALGGYEERIVYEDL